MCGRYSLSVSADRLGARFDVPPPADWTPRYNCAPGQELPVLAGEAPESFRRMHWGFTPSWAEESFDLINARAETVADKRTFAEAYERRRCLVPADGFYEWVEDGGTKRPYRVAFEDDRVFAMAGVYETWKPPVRQTGLGEWGGGSGEDDGEDDRVESFAVLTTEPNDAVAELHHRMAVVLSREREADWLAGELTHEDLLEPYPGDSFRSYPVSTRVNSPTNDDPSLLEPVANADERTGPSGDAPASD